jgi:hypothetical protein
VLREELISTTAFVRRRNTWYAITLATFLSGNFFLAMVLVGAIVAFSVRREENPLALYAFVLFAVPPLSMPIPGFGPIEHFFYLNHYRLLNLVILVPAAISLASTARRTDQDLRVPDAFVIALIATINVLQFSQMDVVGASRGAFYLLLDIWVPYYVASRSLRSIAHFHDLASSFLVAASILAVLAVFETTRYWLLYDALRGALGVPIYQSDYLLRGDGGPLRSLVSLGHAIILGYVFVVAIALLLSIKASLLARSRFLLAFLCVIGGLLASLSRGPWVGAAAAMLAFALLGPDVGKRLARSAGLVSVVFVLVAISPWGDAFIALLPFVGSVEPGSVEYRQNLLDVSIEVLRQNLWLGDINFLSNPLMERMRQGQGIIDVVNGYLQYALPYGLLGLCCFVACLLVAGLAANSARRIAAKSSLRSAEEVGRGLLAALVGTIVTIGTVSNIGAVPAIYWLLVGMLVAYAATVRDLVSTATSTAPPPQRKFNRGKRVPRR